MSEKELVDEIKALRNDIFNLTKENVEILKKQEKFNNAINNYMIALAAITAIIAFAQIIINMPDIELTIAGIGKLGIIAVCFFAIMTFLTMAMKRSKEGKRLL